MAASLSQLAPGALIDGLDPAGPVAVIQSQAVGGSSVQLTFRRTDGTLDDRIIFADRLSALHIVGGSRARAFDADGSLFKLAAEAARIRLAHLFDPFLADALGPFVEREMDARAGASWRKWIDQELERKLERRPNGSIAWEIHPLLKTAIIKWADVFRKTLGSAKRSLVGELLDVRNEWAHQKAFSYDDTHRALDSAERLLRAISAGKAADEVNVMRQEVLRTMFAEQRRTVERRQTTLTLETAPKAGLQPWREVIMPHPDVATGRYAVAEFAADLAQVRRGGAGPEYGGAAEFFRRTFLTTGLSRLLVGAMQRLAGQGGDPVIELQTNFGGGKTHSMLALYHMAGHGKPEELAGSFASNLTFAQSLSEAVKAVPGALLVASLPASQVEIGGDGGQEALSVLKNTFGRVENSWKPATAQEGFEIVRRRLFQPMSTREAFAARDAVVKAFSDSYREGGAQFPSECGESDYRKLLEAAYPVHPEFFARLNDDWGGLDKFQRTRGVLRLMASVINVLWEQGDKSLLIMPGSLPLDEPSVLTKLLDYLPQPWDAIVGADIDGSHARAYQIDKNNPNLQKQLAADFASYLYLPRLSDRKLLAEAVRSAISQLVCDQLGYAEAYDAAAGRYVGLQATSAGGVSILFDDSAVIVKPEAANAQLARERRAPAEAGYPQATSPPTPAGVNDPPSSEGAHSVLRRFYGSFEFRPDRLVREAGSVSAEVLGHLAQLQGVQITARLEIDVHVPGGIDDDIRRIVEENCRSLRFRSAGFEAE